MPPSENHRPCVHDYTRYYDYEHVKLGLQGLSPVEHRLRNRLLDGTVTVQFLGISSVQEKFMSFNRGAETSSLVSDEQPSS